MDGLRARLLESTPVDPLSDTDANHVHDYYQSVLDSVGSVVYTVNRNLRITGVNRQWDSFALANGGQHLSSEHILGSHLLDQMDGAPLERWRVVCRQIFDGELARYLDEIASEAPSTWRHYSLTATPLCDGQGKIQGITFVATNITQLKKAEHEMFRRLIEIRGLRQVTHTAGTWTARRRAYKQVTAGVAHLFDADKCVIFLWDESTGHLQAQEPAFGLAGRKLADLWLDMGSPVDSESLWPDLEEKNYTLLNEGDDAPADMIETSARIDRLAAMLAVLRISGRIRGAILVAGHDHPFTDQDGRLLAHLAVPIALSIENTELNQRLLDRTHQLAATRDELDRAVKLKETIRMPLGVVQGYLELLLDGVLGPLPEGQLATMHTVLDKTQAIISLINRISPPRLPRDATRYESVCLADLVRKVLDQQVSSIEQAELNLIAQLPAPHDENSVTVGDPDMLYQVFDALLDNAIKFSQSGGSINVLLHVLDDIVHVKIVDAGTGVPTDQLLRIWKPKKRAGRSGPINLSEVKRIVEGHGGQVWAESTPGQGSTFHVVLRKKPDRSPSP